MITLAWTVLFCLGWRTVTDEGQLLYFIRKFFEDNQADLEHKEVQLDFDKSSDLIRQIRRHKLLYFIGKPLVMCITCMASIWGTVIYLHFNWQSFGISELLINCICASFIQTFIYKLYVKLD